MAGRKQPTRKPKRRERRGWGGIGEGKGTWKRRRYLSDGTVIEDPQDSAPERGPGVHTRFVPFVSHQVHHKAAKDLGLKRTKTRGTVFTSERQLNDYIAYERRHGREVGWKDHDWKG